MNLPLVMSKSLLFIPDISGFTKFIQTTEVEHSQHVIAELLEVLIDANTQGFQLAEVEGDALFFYKEKELLSLEMILAQVEMMFTAFHSHLKLLETNRICPCNACKTAPNLQLKIVAHCGELQFITVQDNRKPFGTEVIEVHRLMKNSVDSDNYVLISKALVNEIGLPLDYRSKLFSFNHGKDSYDGKEIEYAYSKIKNENLKINPLEQVKKIHFERSPNLVVQREFPVDAFKLIEYLSNYRYRTQWLDGIDKIEFNETEVTRLGTEHKCVVKGSDLDFITITKKAKPGQLVYGEFTSSPPVVDELYQFYIISPMTDNYCKVDVEAYWIISSPIKKLIMATFGKIAFKKTVDHGMDSLLEFTKKRRD